MLVYRKGLGVVPLSEGPPKSIHYVENDSMPPVLNHADGKVYDSKSKIRESYRRHGVLEVGNDKVSKYLSKTRTRKPFPEEKLRDAMEKSYSQLNDPSFRRAFRERERDRVERLIRDGYKP